MIYCVDMDDLCDATADTLDVLLRVKEKVPPFKVCLFTIPKRTSPATIARFKEYPWIALAPHGWRHTRGECLSWSVEEAVSKLRLARSMGIDAPAFRAPAWLIDRSTYEACSIEGITVCDHREYRCTYENSRVYTYNHVDGRAPKTRSIHGHLSRVLNNYIGDMETDGRLTLHQSSTFAWPWEVAVPNPLTDDGSDQ
jgi:hypothetical protein